MVGELLKRKPDWSVDFAENGTKALAQIRQSSPDVVVTDMQMPEMDGLDVVTHVRQHHPGIPVILITAFGSEMLALEALARGAASYVPKSHLPDRLLATLDEVLVMAGAKSSYERLIDCLTSTEFNFSIDNDDSVIDPMVILVQQMAVSLQFCDFAERLQIGVALSEAIRNAIYHGNLEISFEDLQQIREKLLSGQRVDMLEERRQSEPFSSRVVRVTARVSPEEIRLVVADEGPGFDVSTIPPADDPAALDPEKGRGLSLMRTFMDEVTFNESGNTVTMIKRRGGSETAG
jgi:CheY-like chemotaxis protein/anti-sigma regulatory factor (Ser/Thr protein kinase)